MSAFTYPLKEVCDILDVHDAYDDIYPANETVFYDGFSSSLVTWKSDNATIENVNGRCATTGTNNLLATLDIDNLIVGRQYHVTIQAMLDVQPTDVQTAFAGVRAQSESGGDSRPINWQMQNVEASFTAVAETETLVFYANNPGLFTVKWDNLRITGDAFTITHAQDFTALGLSAYPIFNSSYRAGLNKKIVDHYWNREIGFETIELFIMKLKTLMNEIMPYYNQLYATTVLEYGPLDTINLTTHSTGQANTTENNTGSATNHNTTDAQGRSVQSSTPQTVLSGAEDYATGAADSRSQTTADSTASQSSDTTASSDTLGETRVTGYQGAAATLIMNYRDSLINIDLMIIRDLEQLFMQVFDNSSAYTQRGIFW